jgi:hypothetical protein
MKEQAKLKAAKEKAAAEELAKARPQVRLSVKVSEGGSDRRSLRQSKVSKKMSIQMDDDDEHDMKGKLLKTADASAPTEEEIKKVEAMLKREKTHAQWDKHAICFVVLGA